ncbi:hypothetical protein DKX38_021958 [Salix brachista]|uniref:Timeless N-terminal domain-containing protein n=1 Tax=Salix brachista TaxID=2182728 RepID=A0A5N5JYH0_9ROSI|nr:hypothetical protein DKX38_021958 [Salix brachista]
MEMQGLAGICVGLGTPEEDDNGNRIGYNKGANCSDNLKDLLRFLRRDDPQTRGVFKQVCKWNTVGKDLIPIIQYCQDDRNLVLNAVKVLVFLTMPIEPSSSDIWLQVEYLWGLKAAITLSDTIPVVVSLLEGPLENLDREAFTEDDWKLVQLVLTLFRNVLAIHDFSMLQKVGESASQFLSLRDRFLELLFHENVMDIILVIAQNIKGSCSYFLHDNLLLLEIFHYIFLGQEPELIVNARLKDFKVCGSSTSLDILKSIMKEEKQKKMKLSRQRNVVRHSQFSGTFTRLAMDGSKTVCKGNPSSASQILLKPHKAQKGPSKKILWDHERLPSMKDDILELLHDFLNQFLSGGYNDLMESIREDIEKEHHAIQNSDIVVFFQVAQFVTSFQYHKYFTSKPNMEEDNSQAFSDEYADNTSFKGGICGPIAASMNESMFLLVIARWQNAFEGLKVTHDYKFLSAAGALMRIMIRMLDLVLKLMPGDSKEPLTARILLYKLFYDQTDQGMTQFLLSLIKSFDTHKQTKSDLSDLVEMIHLIVRLMENLQTRGTLRVSKKSRSRKKKILSDKKENVNEQCDAEATIEDPTSLSNSEQSTVLKKKSPEIATSGDEENMNVDVLEKPEISVPEMENLGNNLQTEKKNIDIDDLSRSSDDSSGDEQPAANNEVDFKVSTFISSLANHSIIQNLCWLLGFYKNNSVSTNHYIVCMLQRITDDLDLSPMLYQLSLLTTFYDILEEQKSCPCKEYANIVDFLTSLVRRMLRKMKNQPLLFVEVLFWKSRKECHYINAEYMLHELGHLKKESAGWGNAPENEDIGSSQGKIWAPRSIADALGEDEADVVIPHEPRYQSGGDAAEHESVSVPRRKRRFVLTEEMEMKIKDLYEKFKDDENCSRLIAESLDPDGQVSPAQVINKLKQLGLKVALKKRKRSVGRPFSTNPDRLGENGEIIEKESNLLNSIDLEGSLPRLSTRRRVRAFNKDQEELIKALFEQFKDHRRCSYMIANALGSDNSFTAAQVSRKLKQLGLRTPRQKHSDTDIHLRDEELNDFSVGQDSDDETLLSLKNRSKNKDDGVLFGDELPSQNIEGESSDSDDELLCSILKPKNNAGGRLFVGEQNNEGEISDNSDNEILSSKINKTKKLLSKAKGKELRTESEMPGEDAGDEALNDPEQRDRGREFTGRDVAGIEEDIVPDHVSKDSASEAEAIDNRSGKSTGVSPVNYVDNTPYEQMDDALEDLEDAAASDTVVTSARLKRKLRMVVDLEDDDD